ncbi:ATP-binding protein [Streptomyces profundus]|uniref:ATP-binding protein n=1 Tax=Streptomyces profundus TaxID=2867410 RepID=UPI001D16934C|nr:ATP-binding protein [Streptomyces sp. MA3_2.13]UED86325.1 ATP-binding protein [Streptomyces sp. MA3_2.13]
MNDPLPQSIVKSADWVLREERGPGVPEAFYSDAFTGTPEVIARWRREVKVVLARWGAAGETECVVSLGVSELLANVVRHSTTRRCWLRVLRVGPDVVVQVFDESKHLPVVHTPDDLAEDGRGLWLLREMADAFGFMPKQYTSDTGPALGKIVWFACWDAFPEKAGR